MEKNEKKNHRINAIEFVMPFLDYITDENLNVLLEKKFKIDY